MTTSRSNPHSVVVHRNSLSNLHRQSGVGLLEIMIAVIVLAVGFLAAAKMQAEGLRNTQAAYINSQAGFLLKDMTDRMRSNITGVEDGHYDAIDTETANANIPACANQGASGVSCSPAQIAQLDIAEWSAYIRPNAGGASNPVLPSGDNTQARGTVAKVGDIYRVNLTWSEVIRGNETEQSLAMDIVP